LDELRRQEASARTIENYRSDLARFAAWFAQTVGKPFAAAAVTPTDVREYKAYLQHIEKRQPATVNRRLAGLRKFFAWAASTGHIAEAPTRQVKGLGAVQPAPKALTKREADKLLREVEQAHNKRDVAVLRLLRHTGLRVSELCNLRLGDITMSARAGQAVVRSGKGNKYRAVPLNVPTRAAIREYLDVRPKTTDDQLFIGQRGPLKSEGVEDLVKKYAYHAGLSGVTPHVLRHTFGKQLLDSGVNLVTVAALMGHSRLETTALYTQPSARDLAQAVDRLTDER
jgi:integrase/recombinase XerC